MQGLGQLPDSDIHALATYLADVDKAADRLPSVSAAVSHAMSYALAKPGEPFDPDARLYTAACASCHYNEPAHRSRPGPTWRSTARCTFPTRAI